MTGHDACAMFFPCARAIEKDTADPSSPVMGYEERRQNACARAGRVG
jgi:hypothetical protein